MQIKAKGNRIYLLRSVYDPTIKRSKQEVLGSSSRYGLGLSPETLASLRPDEQAEWDSYVRSQRQANAESSERHAMEHLATRLNTFLDAVRKHPEGLQEHEQEWADALMACRNEVIALARAQRQEAKAVAKVKESLARKEDQRRQKRLGLNQVTAPMLLETTEQ